MTTQLSHGPELRNKVLNGVNTLADYVATTLGPKGQNVLIRKKDKSNNKSSGVLETPRKFMS